MKAVDGHPAPGAVVVISGPAGFAPSQARAAAVAAFDGHSEVPELFADGSLTVAWLPATGRAVHVSEHTICLLEGTLYELGDAASCAEANGPAARVLAEAYMERGVSMLPALRGDFWTLLWDRQAARGVVAVDQLGGRTPYWARSGDSVLVASEVPELLAALPRRPDPDPISLAHWLMFSGRPGGSTLFSGVRRLGGAHLLVVGRDGGEPKRYWSPTYSAPARLSRDDAVAGVRERLSAALARRLQGVNSPGLRLSGGIDSSVVAAIAAHVVGDGSQLHAYSATFPDHPTMNEAHLIDQTVEALGLRSTRIVVREGGVTAGALQFINSWQLPPASPNLYFWIPLLARAAADGSYVLLDGEGGDEVFGLSPYLLADRLRRGRVLSAIALARRVPTSGRADAAGRVWRLIRRFGLKGAMPASAHIAMRRLAGPARYAPPWMPSKLARDWLASEEEAFSWKRLEGPRWWAYLVDAVTRGLGPAMVYEQTRRLTAQAGLEGRHPLVDVDVIEFMLQLPPELAFDARVNRPLVRDAVAGLLPDEVRLRRRKSNFDALFHSLLAGPELPLVRRLLQPTEAQLGRYIDLDVVWRELLAGDPPVHAIPRMHWATTVWRMVTAECWLRAEADGSFPARLAAEEGLTTGSHELISVT